jgi:hypothetical protein
VVDLLTRKIQKNYVFFIPWHSLLRCLQFCHVHPRFTGGVLKANAMQSPRPLLLMTLALLAMLSLPAAAQEQPRCLSRAEQRAAIAAGEAIPLATARQMLRQRMSGELVRARLCRESGRLIYRLTVLARDGKVRQVTIDATNGTVIGGL